MLVRVARGFHSTVTLKCGERVADVRNILSVLMLCAALGTIVEIEANGDDEQVAAAAVERVFSPDNDLSDSAEVM